MLGSLLYGLPDLQSVPSLSCTGLLSLSGICMSLHRISSVDSYAFPKGESLKNVALSRTLYDVIFERLASGKLELKEQALLTDTLLDLARETTFVYSSDRECQDRDCFYHLLDYVEKNVTSLYWGDEWVAILRSEESFLYPNVSEEGAEFLYLQRAVYDWCDTWLAVGSWKSLSLEQVWHRLDVLNRYSYMFLDKSCDGVIRKIFAYCKSATLASPVSVPLANICLKVCLPGHLCAFDVDLSNWCSKALLLEEEVSVEGKLRSILNRLLLTEYQGRLQAKLNFLQYSA